MANNLPDTLRNSSSKSMVQVLDKYRAEMEAVAPPHVSAERILYQAAAIFTRDHNLQVCRPDTIVAAVLQAACLGLEIDPIMQHIAFVPIRKDGVALCELWIQYSGLIQLIRNSGEVQNIRAKVVREEDEFDYRYGTDPFIHHKPKMSNRGELTHAYAILNLLNGGEDFIVLEKSEVMAVKAVSRGAESPHSPWNKKDQEQWMWAKCAIKVIRKYAPISTNLHKQMASDQIVIPGLKSFNPETKELDYTTVDRGEIEEPKINGNGDGSEPKKEADQRGAKFPQEQTKEKPSGGSAKDLRARCSAVANLIIREKDHTYLKTVYRQLGINTLEDVEDVDLGRTLEAFSAALAEAQGPEKGEQ